MNWSEEDYQAFLNRRRNNSKGNVVKEPLQGKLGRKSGKMKYHSQKVEKYGHNWDSKRELAEYEKLLVLQRQGIIRSIELQPKFELQPGYIRNGKKIQPLHYIADFKVTMPDGAVRIIDVKSTITEKNPVYRIKRKLLLYRFPDIDFAEIM